MVRGWGCLCRGRYEVSLTPSNAAVGSAGPGIDIGRLKSVRVHLHVFYKFQTAPGTTQMNSRVMESAIAEELDF